MHTRLLVKQQIWLIPFPDAAYNITVDFSRLTFVGDIILVLGVCLGQTLMPELSLHSRTTLISAQQTFES